MNEPIIQVRDVVVEYEGITKRVRAVAGVNLSVSQGEILGLVGESGCGKSSLGKALVGILPLYEGEVYFAGKKLKKLQENSEYPF